MRLDGLGEVVGRGGGGEVRGKVKLGEIRRGEGRKGERGEVK